VVKQQSLAAFYACYFAILGVFLPYWGTLLKHQGVGDGMIGVLLAVFIAPRIFAPFITAWIADISGKTTLVLRIAAVLMTLGFTLLFYSSNLWVMAISAFVCGFFYSSLLPKFEAITLSTLHATPERYTLIRLWGSFGFLLAVMLGGDLLERFGANTLTWMVLVFCAGIIAITFTFQVRHQHEPNPPSFATLIKNPTLLILLLIALLQQLSHGAYYSYFSLFLESVHYSKTIIGLIWGIGVAAEILLFVLLPKRLNPAWFPQLLTFSLFITAGRWVLTAWLVDVPWLLGISQFLHAASFALFHVIAVIMIKAFFSNANHMRGQALYSIASFGAGGMAGSVLAALVIDASNYTMAFYMSALPPLLALGLMGRIRRYWQTANSYNA
jgi:MFS transporter, PPP family, 3-phenylpropionic acid transporter